MFSLQGVSRWGAMVLVFLVAACTGGAGGPGAALDGGGGPGGPVGGGNFAAGPVSLPSTASAPLNPVEWTSIGCMNIPGPDFWCEGKPLSVPAHTVVEFKIYPPASGQARDSFSTTAGADGSWSVTRAGVPGENLEICPLINGSCHGTRFVKIPPEGAGVEASQGATKNLVIDAQGKGWYSRWLPKGGWLSWLVGEAHAQEAAPLTMVECRGATAEWEFGTVEGPRCHLFSRAPDGAVRIELSFDNCNQNDIRSIVAAEDPTTREPLLLVAVKRLVYVIKTSPAPQVVRRYNFPDPVTAILSQGSHYSVLASSLDRPLYFLDLRPGSASDVGCYDLDEDLKGLVEITSSHGIDHHFALSGFFQNEGVSEYRVLVGSYVAGGTKFQQSPVTLLRSSSPIETRILRASDSEVVVAALQHGERRLSIIRHPYSQPGLYFLYLYGGGNGGGSGDQVFETSLANLEVSGRNYSVQRPQLLEVDPRLQQLGFLDFTDRGTKLLTLRYVNSGGEIEAPRTAVVTELGTAVPTLLRIDATQDNGVWTYGEAHGSLNSVRPMQETGLLDELAEGE